MEYDERYIRTDGMRKSHTGRGEKKDSDTNIFDRGGTLSVKSIEIKII